MSEFQIRFVNAERAMKASKLIFHYTKPAEQTQRLSLYFIAGIDVLPSHCATVALCSLHRYHQTRNEQRSNNIHSGHRGRAFYRAQKPRSSVERSAPSGRDGSSGKYYKFKVICDVSWRRLKLIFNLSMVSRL